MESVSSAVGFTARLKPEIRLAQAISEFSASLQSKNQRARFKNLHSRSPPSPDDIVRLSEEINRDGARAHRSWRPYGTRLIAILERMRQFASIGDVLVGGSQNLIACGVWAVVRLSLEVSASVLPDVTLLTKAGIAFFPFLFRECHEHDDEIRAVLVSAQRLRNVIPQVFHTPVLHVRVYYRHG